MTDYPPGLQEHRNPNWEVVQYLENGEAAWGFNGPGWYFWCEDFATMAGPHESEVLARDSLARYVKEFLDG